MLSVLHNACIGERGDLLTFLRDAAESTTNLIEVLERARGDIDCGNVSLNLRNRPVRNRIDWATDYSRGFVSTD
nr:unnamed protein product [Spirometra erinaceieuropaei]